MRPNMLTLPNARTNSKRAKHRVAFAGGGESKVVVVAEQQINQLSKQLQNGCVPHPFTLLQLSSRYSGHRHDTKPNAHLFANLSIHHAQETAQQVGGTSE